jgi:hypothetical protein
MEQSKQELAAQNLILTERLKRLEKFAACAKEGLHYYSDPNCNWDNGKQARKALKNASDPKYKPVNSMIAQIFKEKPIKWLSPDDAMVLDYEGE